MSLRHAILGFLSARPMTGYDLRKTMTQTMEHFWPVDQAQIYRTLSSLAEDGLVRVETEVQTTRPNRRIHHILPAGEAELDDWLMSPLETEPTREPFVLRLFLAGQRGGGSVRALLTVRVGAMKLQISALKALERTTKDAEEKGIAARLRLATVENALAHARAERDWAKALLEEL